MASPLVLENGLFPQMSTMFVVPSARVSVAATVPSVSWMVTVHDPGSSGVGLQVGAGGLLHHITSKTHCLVVSITALMCVGSDVGVNPLCLWKRIEPSVMMMGESG